MEVRKPVFNWKDFEISPEEAQKAKNLVEDNQIITTFLAALDLLKEQRRLRTITIDEITKGLIEIATAIEKFIEYTDAFTDLEIKLQINMLEGFIDVLCDSLKTFGQTCPVEKRFNELKGMFDRGKMERVKYWKELIHLTVELLNYIHDLEIPPKYLRFVLSVILAFVDYFQCVLIHKRELVEDFLGEEEG